MAKVIQNFLIGVGLDTREFKKGEKEVTSGLNKVRTVSGLAGTALIGAFGAAATSAISAGKRIDQLALSTEKFDTSSQFIYAYGNALRALGGDAGEAVTAIQAAESALDEFRLKGSFSAFEDPVLAGVDTFTLTQAVDGEDFLRKLSDMLPDLSKGQQRLIQENFGLSDAAMRSLRDGSAHFDTLVARADQLGGSIEGASEASREFNKNLAEMGTALESVSNSLAEKMLPSLGGILSKVTDFIAGNKEEFDAATNIIAGSTGGATAMGAGAALSTAAATAGALGVGGSLAPVLAATGAVGMIGGAGMMAMQAKPDDIEKLTGYRPNDYIFENTPVDLVKDTWNWAWDKPSGFDRYSKDSAKDSVTLNQEPLPIGMDNPAPTEINYQGLSYDDITKMHGSPDVFVDVAPATVEAQREANSPKESKTIKDPVQVNNSIDLNVTLGGRQFEAEVTDIIERREQVEFESLQSTTRF